MSDEETPVTTIGGPHGWRSGHETPANRPPTSILTAFELRILNEARTILAGVEKDVIEASYKAAVDDRIGSPQPAAYGRVAEAAATAGDAIFNVLNTMNAYRVQPIASPIMENRTPDEPEAS